MESIYNEALAGHPLETVDRLLLMPMMEDLGVRWTRVAGGVAEEHFFSAYVRNKIGARFHHRRMHQGGPKILAACAPGELHEIGLLLFALAAHEAGCRVVLLGANVPLREAAAAARRAQCDAIVISNAIAQGSPAFYSELAGLVAAVNRPVYVGGNGVAAREKQIEATGAVALPTSIDSAIRRLTAEAPATGRRG
jgi:methanogenic corrinoid protein MtbC1